MNFCYTLFDNSCNGLYNYSIKLFDRGAEHISITLSGSDEAFERATAEV